MAKMNKAGPAPETAPVEQSPGHPTTGGMTPTVSEANAGQLSELQREHMAQAEAAAQARLQEPEISKRELKKAQSAAQKLDEDAAAAKVLIDAENERAAKAKNKKAK